MAQYLLILLVMILSSRQHRLDVATISDVYHAYSVVRMPEH